MPRTVEDEELPELTESLLDIDRIIREIALKSDYHNAPHFEINRQALREVAFSEFRAAHTGANYTHAIRSASLLDRTTGRSAPEALQTGS